MTGVAAGLVAASGLVVVALLCSFMARLIRLRQLEPNGVIGLRTRATRSSRRAWDAGHDAARPLMLVTAITAATTAALLVTAGAMSNADLAADAVPTWLVLTGYTVVLVLLVAAGVVADRAAKAAS